MKLYQIPRKRGTRGIIYSVWYLGTGGFLYSGKQNTKKEHFLAKKSILCYNGKVFSALAVKSRSRAEQEVCNFYS